MPRSLSDGAGRDCGQTASTTGRRIFCGLTDPADQAAFRQWFTAIADYQAVRPKAEVPQRNHRLRQPAALRLSRSAQAAQRGMVCGDRHEVAHCPGRFAHGIILIHRWARGCFASGREALKPTDASERGLCAVCRREDAGASATPISSAAMCGRRSRAILLFYRQFGQSSPWHSMIVTRVGGEPAVVYDTGTDHGKAGELRRVAGGVAGPSAGAVAAGAGEPEFLRRLPMEYSARNL